MTEYSGKQVFGTMILLTLLIHQCMANNESLKPVCISNDGNDLVLGKDSATPFHVWGFNYDHDADGRLIEAYWTDEWDTVVSDFKEMKALGANVVRIHLQLGKFMEQADTPNMDSLNQFGRLLALAETTGLYLDITGLACYHKPEVPEWYDPLPEAERWAVQALFWESIAKVAADSPAIFCYDLMNEPILPGSEPATEWLTGEFGGNFFVQRISLDLDGRTQKEVARAWVDTLVKAIRKQDKTHLITVGAIPWAHSFPGAKPLFYSPEVGENLDYVSVHFYPEKDRINEAITALKVYDIGKPIVVEEMFPLSCGIDGLDEFIEGARDVADGFVGFYWGKTIEEYAEDTSNIAAAITREWLEYFRENAAKLATRP